MEPIEIRKSGPKTEEGKQRSSRNSFKHGLFSRELVLLDNETQEEYDALLSGLIENHKPATATEEFLVKQLADLQWRIARIPALESKAIESSPDPARQLDTYGKYSRRMNSEYQSVLKTLHEEQAPRLIEHGQKWRTAVLLREHLKRDGIDWDPASVGFVFSKDLIDQQIAFNKSWDGFCKRVIIHATTKYQDEFFSKLAL